jgi:ferredoxin
MSYRPIIDEHACSGHGDCAVVAPDVFELDDIAVVIGAGEPEEVLQAAEACPTAAITVIDTDTGDQIYP